MLEPEHSGVILLLNTLESYRSSEDCIIIVEWVMKLTFCKVACIVIVMITLDLSTRECAADGTR